MKAEASNRKTRTASKAAFTSGIAECGLGAAHGSASGSEKSYEDGWRDGMHAAENIFDAWYRNNCITAGATNSINFAMKQL
jgi:hypothetical protein